MNSASKYAVVASLSLCLTGCAAKKVQAVSPPPQAQAPAVASSGAGAMYPPPLTQAPAQTEQPAAAPAPEVAESTPTAAPEPEPEESKKTSVHKPKPPASKPGAGSAAADNAVQAAPVTSPTPPPAESASVMAAGGEPEATSPIGQLSTGDTAGRTQTRKDTVDLITSTENGLNGIKRSLSAEEQETANRIKTFLAKAKQALTNSDLDGAYTLATKAKVLLDELVKT